VLFANVDNTPPVYVRLGPLPPEMYAVVPSQLIEYRLLAAGLVTGVSTVPSYLRTRPESPTSRAEVPDGFHEMEWITIVEL